MENGGTLSYHRFLLVKYLLFAAILVSLESPESSATYPGWIFFAYLSCAVYTKGPQIGGSGMFIIVHDQR